jgi:heme exporter protein D
MTEFFAMSGYGFYIWCSYGLTAVLLAVEVAAIRARRRAILEEARLSGPDETHPAVTSTGVTR